MDRFSLLLLEPGEIYFCDVGVTLHGDANATSPNPKEQVSQRRVSVFTPVMQ